MHKLTDTQPFARYIYAFHSLERFRSINLHLTYHDDVTPADYEPPGFMSSIFELDTLFNEQTSRMLYGTAISTHHRLALSMETLAAKEELADSNMAVKGASSQQVVEMTQSIAKLGCEPPTKRIDEQAHDPTLAFEPETLQVNGKRDVPKEKVKAKRKNVLPPISDKGVRCMCGDQEQDLGMVQCDECKAWEHVVCAGYFSNSDKRLDTVDKRSCYYCGYGQSSPAILTFLRELCRIRRALSVMYGEGFGNCHVMSKRLGNQITFIIGRPFRGTICSPLQTFGS